jgi:hypothetical protein
MHEEIALAVIFFARILQRNGKYFLLIAALVMRSAAAADVSDVMAPLTANVADEKDMARALEAAKELSPTERLVLENHLRLRQGAALMANQYYGEARAAFKTIETSSSVAPQAGLLIAESYRLEGLSEKAKDWFLRTARFYPYRSQTLEGLLSAAEGQRQDSVGLALALYAEVETQTAYALEQLSILNSQDSLDPLAVIFPSDIDEHVREALLMRCLQYSDKDLLDESARLQKAVKTILALRTQNKVMRDEMKKMSQTLTDYTQQREHLLTVLAQHDAQLAALKSKLIAHDLSEAQQSIRLQIVQLINEQARLRGQMAFIDQASEKLPLVMNNIEQQLVALNKRTRATLSESNRSVSEILTGGYEGYRVELINLGAQASVQRAEMRMSSAQ